MTLFIANALGLIQVKNYIPDKTMTMKKNYHGSKSVMGNKILSSTVTVVMTKNHHFNANMTMGDRILKNT